jgi:hypothetical protein
MNAHQQLSIQSCSWGLTFHLTEEKKTLQHSKFKRAVQTSIISNFTMRTHSTNSSMVQLSWCFYRYETGSDKVSSSSDHFGNTQSSRYVTTVSYTTIWCFFLYNESTKTTNIFIIIITDCKIIVFLLLNSLISEKSHFKQNHMFEK